MLFHQVRDDRGRRPADTCIAVDKNSATCRERILHKAQHRSEVLLKIRSRRVQLGDPFVGVLLRELGVQARADRENVRDTVAIEYVLIRRCDLVPKEETFNDLVQRLDTIVPMIYHLN